MTSKAKTTEKLYESYNKMLTEKIIKKPMNLLILNAKEVYDLLNDYEYEKGKKYDIHSIRNYLKYILSWMKDNNIDEELKESFVKYYDYLSNEVNKRYNEKKLSERREKGLISWEEFLNKREELRKVDKYSQEYLLLCMYSYIPVVRQDYNRVKIYKDKIENKKDENYLNIINDGEKMELYLKEFKTAKRYKIIKTILPEELKEVIKDSLIKNPRDYLFISNLNKPYSSSGFTGWSNDTLCELFRKVGLTIGLLRKISISEKTLNATVESKIELARQMGHSIETQEKYKLARQMGHSIETQ